MNRLSQPALAFFFGDLMKARLQDFAKTTPYLEGEGLSVAARGKALEKLDQLIEQAEAKLIEIKQQASEAGISLETREPPDEEKLFQGGTPVNPDARRKALLRDGPVLRDNQG